MMLLKFFIPFSALLIAQNLAKEYFSAVSMLPNVDEQVIEAGSTLTLSCTADDRTMIQLINLGIRPKIEIKWLVPAITQYQEV